MPFGPAACFAFSLQFCARQSLGVNEKKACFTGQPWNVTTVTKLRLFLVLIQPGHAFFLLKKIVLFPKHWQNARGHSNSLLKYCSVLRFDVNEKRNSSSLLTRNVVWHGAGGEEEVRFPLNTYQLLPFLESFSVVGKHRQVELKHSSGPRENFAGGFSAKQMVFPWSTPWAICLDMTNQKTWSFFLLGTR